MGYFLNELELGKTKMVGGDRYFWLESDFIFHSTKHGPIVAPAGFAADGASVPRPFRNLFSPTGALFEAAVIHDFLYSEQNIFFTRKEADEIFLEAMRSLGVAEWKGRIVYRSVRSFGWMHYKGNPPS